MASLLLKNMLAFQRGIRNQGTQIHQQIVANEELTFGNFTFKPLESIVLQLRRFKKKVANDDWNGNLQFLGFKGTFKVEYWIYLEERLRDVEQLGQVEFIDTQIDYEHLVVLKRLLQWIQPQNFELKFKQNEIDDLDIEDFIYNIFNSNLQVQKILILSNPGIFKGHFIMKLQNYLKDKYNTNKQFYYHLEISQIHYSIGIKKIYRNIDDQEIQKEINELKEQLLQTFYYDLNFAKCFTNQNYKAFEFLIKECYHEDNLEQLSSLNISDCDLGSISTFKVLCQNIATAKGLITLDISKQDLLKNSTVVQALMGDRYDQLRINNLIFERNGEIVEKSFKTLAQALLLRNCKKFVSNRSLPQALPTLYKMFIMTEAFQKELKLFKVQMKKTKCIPSLQMEELDISVLENYNRHDLALNFIQALVYNEFSAIKVFTLQNVDIGRSASYVTAVKQFNEHIALMKQTNPIYQNYKHPMTQVNLYKQSFRQEEEPFKTFLFSTIFTKQGGPIEVLKSELKECFRIKGAESGFKATLAEIKRLSVEEPETKFTLKKIKFNDCKNDFSLADIEALFFTKSLQLESLEFYAEQWEINYKEFEDMAVGFFKTLEPNQIYSLKVLKLHDVYDFVLELGGFIKNFIYNPQIQLEEFQISLCSITVDLEKFVTLDLDEAQFEQSGFRMPLKHLTFGEFEGGQGYKEIMRYVALSRFCRLESLNLTNIKIKDCIKDLSLIVEDQFKLNVDCLERLQTLTVGELDLTSSLEWQLFSQIFIFPLTPTLTDLIFKNTKITKEWQDGLTQSILPVIEIQKQKGEGEQLAFQMTSLKFEGCTFNQEIFSVFLTNIICNIKNLEIIDCVQFEECVSQFKQEHIENIEYLYTFSLVKVVLQNAKFKSIDNFQWFLKNIALNQQRQLLEELSLIECDLSDDVIVFLANLIKEAKLYEKKNFINKYFRLRSLNFENNPKIGQQAWIQLFRQMLNTEIEGEEKQSPKKQQQNQVITDKQGEEIEEKQQEHNSQVQQELEGEQQKIAKAEAEEVGSEEKRLEIEEQKRISDEYQIQITEQQELNQQYIDNNQLCLIDKIMNNSQQFSLQYPQKLLELEVDMKFADDTKECKSEIYLRIIKGFIMFPGSKLETLKLSNLDLDIFMEQSESALTFARKYISKDQQLEEVMDIQLPLKVIEINSISNKSPDSNRKFAQLYVCNPNISPIKLIATSFDIEFIEELLDYANKSNQKQSLRELELNSIAAQLNEQQSRQFFDQFLIGDRFNVESLKICKEIQFTDFVNNEYQQSTTQIKQQNHEQDLQKLQICLQNTNQAEIWSKLLLLIYQLKVDLKSLTITQDSEYDVLQELIKVKDTLIFDSLQTLVIDQVYTIDINIFNFILSIRKHLKELTIKKLKFKEEDVELIKNLELQIGKQHFPECHFEFTELPQQQEFIYEYFVFSSLLKFNNVQSNHLDSFKQIVYPKSIDHILYLHLSFGLTYNSQKQLADSGLKEIGDRLIYNEESQLQELVFHQCHLKPPGIAALTSGADSFRKKIIAENRESTAQLNLKRLNIYYSLYEGEDGAEALSNNIWFFEYISIERIENEVSNWNDTMNLTMTKAAQQWVSFQKANKRTHQVLPLKYFDFGRNEFVQSKQAWDSLCDTIIFSDLTPNLETLYIHFMAMTDEIVGFLCNKAMDYFSRKPSNYVYPVKRLNYCLNTALTHVGWKQISEQFFFHPKVQFEELNLISTMLDEDAKLEAIYLAGQKCAQLMPNKRLKLHTLLCFNISLKDELSKVMSPRPENYEWTKDIPVKIEFDCYKFGLIDGVPEAIGAQQQQIQKVIQLRNEFINKKWLRSNQVRFSAYHFNFVQHFLVPLNDNTAKIGNKKLNLFFSYKTLDTLAKYFNYASIPPGDPYPLGLLFQADTYTYLRQKSCLIKKIYLLPSEFATNEEVSQMHVLAIWENVKSNRTSIDQIITKYTLNDDLVDEMFARGYQERDIVQLIRIIPPSKIRLQNTLTLQSIKAIYSIFWDSYYFEYSNMTYDFDNYLNIGIGYALREQMYQYQAKNKIGRYFKFFLYHLFNLFVSDAEKYKFDDEVKRLNKFLSSQKLSFLLIAILNLLFFAICILCPYLFTHYVDGDEGRFSELCFRGVSIYSDITYYSFALLSFIVEAYLYKKVSNQVPGHLKTIIKLEIEEDEEESKDKVKQPLLSTQKKNQVGPDVKKQDSSFKNFAMLKKARTQSKVMMKSMQTRINSLAGSDYGLWAAYLMNIVVSQLAKLDFYNDVGFIMRCYYCDYDSLFYAALVVTLFNVPIHLYNYMKLIYHRLTETDQTVKLLNTSFINDFFFISIIGRNIALSSLLDQVAPFNVTVIPNNFITRFLMPNQAGKSMNNSVKNYLLKFSFEDLPQIILQLLFVISEAIKSGGQLGWTIYFTIVISAITILNSLIKFMSIRPSTLTQDNFDKLAADKQKAEKQLELMYNKEEMSIIKTYSEICAKIVKSENGSKDNNQDELDQLL